MVYNSFRFHAVEFCAWLVVSRFIDQVVLARIRQGREQVVISVSDDLWRSLQEFQEQMDIAYLHPRTDSMKIRTFVKRYGSEKVASAQHHAAKTPVKSSRGGRGSNRN